jgi:hypothetical protein
LGISVASFAQPKKIAINTVKKGSYKVDFIRWVLIFKIEVEVNEIGSSIAVKYLFPKVFHWKHPD